jgi:hypothetical protein
LICCWWLAISSGWMNGAASCVLNHGVQVEVLKADLTQKDDVLKLSNACAAIRASACC